MASSPISFSSCANSRKSGKVPSGTLTFPNLNGNKNQLSQQSDESYDKYLQLDFGDTDRTSINPYQIKAELEQITREKIIELTGGNRHKLTIKTSSNEQTMKCLSITSICGKSCTISPHPKFTVCQGLIYLRNCEIEDMDEFKEHLQEQYKVTKVQKAEFIRAKKPGVTAYIVTFNMERTPYTIYIPGEVSDSVVYKFVSKPMMCNKCLQYGHTKKTCRKTRPTCKKCAEEGHEQGDCSNNFLKCAQCSGEHRAGHKECPKQVTEQKILDLVETEKITFQRARQLLYEAPSERPVITKPRFPTLFNCTLPTGIKRKLNPWIMEKAIQQHTGHKPVSCRGKSDDEDTFIVQISTEEESRLMSTFDKAGPHEVTTRVNETHATERGLVFIRGYDMIQDADGYIASLKQQYGIVKVEEATWIRTKNSNALILTFQREMPLYLSIPGENALTRVVEYKRQPLLCKKCLDYGHPQSVCRNNVRCTNCTSLDHSDSTCAEHVRCKHCHGSHRTGNKNCQEFKYEQEILLIQTRSRVSRAQAKIVYDRNNPNVRSLNYAAAVAQNSQNASTSSNSVPTITTATITATVQQPSVTSNASAVVLQGNKTTTRTNSNINFSDDESESATSQPFQPPQPESIPLPPTPNVPTISNRFDILNDEIENDPVMEDLNEYENSLKKRKSQTPPKSDKAPKKIFSEHTVSTSPAKPRETTSKSSHQGDNGGTKKKTYSKHPGFSRKWDGNSRDSSRSTSKARPSRSREQSGHREPGREGKDNNRKTDARPSKQR